MVATLHLGRGYGREAAGIVVTWLRGRGVGTLVAHVHPDHQASQGVARAVGFTATTTMVGEETPGRAEPATVPLVDPQRHKIASHS